MNYRIDKTLFLYYYYIVVILIHCDNCQNVDTKDSTEVPYESDNNNNCNDDIGCLLMQSTDRLALEAIKSLHQRLDDDANGNVDLTESDDFLREELKYNSGYEKRQRAFHRNDDMHISVRELWDAWLKSEVHNWTIEQTAEWLTFNVELPQYVDHFLQHRVNGAALPRLAVNDMHYLTTILGIKDPIHKQKIALKAMDVVLFGSPKDSNSHWKDLTLVTLLFGSVFGCWYAYLQRKRSRKDLNRMLKDMESLHKAELALEDLQKELEQAKLAQENVVTEKQNLEKKLQEAGGSGSGGGGENNSLHNSFSDSQVSQLKAEIEMLRTELQIAEGELKDRCWSPPLGLQHWLQLTHENENKSYIKKKIVAEKQLQQAREACEKLRKKRSSLVGAFVSTHGKSIDEVDRSIVEARTSLNEVTQELQERVYRWKQIELLCGFNIINNNGLQYLENILYRNVVNRSSSSSILKGRMSCSQDDLDDETSSIYAPSNATTGFVVDTSGLVWKDATDSSGSDETSKHDEDVRHHHSNNVHFLVGGETANWSHLDESVLLRTKMNRTQSQQPITAATATITTDNNKALSSVMMIRSQSQDTNITSSNGNAVNVKLSHSEPSIILKHGGGNRKEKPAIKEQHSSSAGGCGDEDVYSTDSSIVDEEKEKKKKRRKLFPTFSRKNKLKSTD